MIGQSVAHYKVTDRLGVGGMGEVYRAHDSKLHRDVALKVLPAALAHDPDYMARFAREAQVLASLNHPNIAAVYGLEESQGATALVMELVPGDTLADRIARGPIPVDQAAELALQIAQALEEAHEHGIIHRDLKPANIKITPEGRVKVLDFGLAKALEANSSAVGLTHSPTISLAATQAGVILGTAGYMSPEQAAAQRTDRRSDIWAFGVVLLEMLTGKRAFTGETVAHVLAAVLHGSPDLSGVPVTVPPRLQDLLRRCLTKDYKARLQAIGDARVVLQEYLANPSSFVEAPKVVAASGAPRSRALLPWAIAALAAAVAVGVGAWALLPREAAPGRPVRMRAAAESEAFFQGVGSSIAISPDGRRLAMVIGSGEDRRLHVRELNQLTSTVLPGTEISYHPFFSPDGQWLGFVTPNELKKISISGGTPLTLAKVSRARGASWGESDIIVFTNSPASALFKMPATGGTPEALTTIDAGKNEISHRWPQILPGGREVLFTVFTSEDAGVGRLEIVDLETGARRVVHHGGDYGRYLRSGHLMYINEGTLFAAPFDVELGEFTRTPAPVVQGVLSGAGGGAHFTASEDGTLVYLEGQAGTPRYELVLSDRRGGATSMTQERQTFVEPRFSPDGRRLAVEIITGSASDSWVYDIERGTATRLTFGDGPDQAPQWSPDGASIVWAAEREDGTNLYRRSSDGSGEETVLTKGTEGKFASSWSPDGGYILFTQVNAQTGNDIMLLDLNSGEPQPYLATDGSEAEGAFSPDGRWVAYQSSESGREEVYVRPFPMRGGKWQISTDSGTHPRWSRSGRELYYRRENAVWMVAVDITGDALRAGTPEKVFDGPFLQANLGGNTYADYDVSPDGQRFAMLRGEGSQAVADHMIVVLNWFDELRSTFAR